MVCEIKGGETVLTGLLEDRSALFGVLGQIEALGLELLELRQFGRDANRLNQAVLAHLTAWEAEPTSPSESRGSMPTQTVRDPNRWAVLALLGVAQLMVVLDATIVTVALPSVQRVLHFSNENRQWVVTAYALAFGSLLLVGGKLGDLFGRKWALIAGLVGFSGASAVGGLAHSFGVLVAARAFQGVFGALLAPAALSLLTVTFAGTADWSRAFGIFGAVAGGAGALGLLLGGVLTQVLSWRWCLYVNLVIAVPTTLVALRLLVNHRPPDRARIDIPGVFTWTLGLFALVFGFSNAETHGWGATATIVALIASPLLLTAFVLIERRVKHPLLPLHIVWDRARGGSYAALLVTGAGIFAVFLFLTYFLQQNLAFSPLKTGLAFLPLSVVLVITSTTVQTRVIQHTGVKPPPPLQRRCLRRAGSRRHHRILLGRRDLWPGVCARAADPAQPMRGPHGDDPDRSGPTRDRQLQPRRLGGRRGRHRRRGLPRAGLGAVGLRRRLRRPRPRVR